jgi:hypothetical protein
MAKDAVEFLYNIATKDGFDGPIDEFLSVINKNPEAFDRVYTYAKATGFNGNSGALKSIIFPSDSAASPTTGGESSGPSLPDDGLLPVQSIIQVRDLPANDGKMKVQKSTSELLQESNALLKAIYESEGYKRKLANEVEQSKSMDLSGGSSRTIGGEKTAAYDEEAMTYENIYKSRLGGLQTQWFPYSENTKDVNSDAYMKPVKDYADDGSGFSVKKAIYYNPKSMEAEGSSEKMDIRVHEPEHSSNYFDSVRTMPDDNKSEFWSYEMQNITPYAKGVIDENVDPNVSHPNKATSKDYLKTYTEIMARKRVTEAYLINNNLIKPGEEVTDEHFEYMLKDSAGRPGGVDEFMRILGISNPYAKPSEETKKKAKERFLNLMNKIAATDRTESDTKTA